MTSTVRFEPEARLLITLVISSVFVALSFMSIDLPFRAAAIVLVVLAGMPLLWLYLFKLAKIRNPLAPPVSAARVLRSSVLTSLVTFSPAFLIAILFVFTRSDEPIASGASDPVLMAELLEDFRLGFVLAPFYETAIFHLGVISLLLKARLRSTPVIVLLAAIVFVGAHIRNGAAGAVAVIPSGFVLPYVYLRWQRSSGSWHMPFIVTWLAHALHNLYYWLLSFIPASFLFG